MPHKPHVVHLLPFLLCLLACGGPAKTTPDAMGSQREPAEVSIPAAGDDETSEPDTDPMAPAPRLLEPYVEPLPERLDQAHTLIADEPLPVLTGGTLATSPAGLVVSSDPARDQLYVVDPATREVRVVELQPGDEPGRVAIDGLRAHVVLRGAGAIATIQLDSLDLSRREVCPAPRGLSLAPDPSHLLVACAGGELVTLSDDGVERTVVLDADLRDVGYDEAGVWVSRYRSAELLRIDASGSIASRAKPGDLETDEFDGPRSFTPTLAVRTLSGPGGSPIMLHQRAQSSLVTIQPGGYGGGQLCDTGIVHATVTRFDSQSDAQPNARPAALPILPSVVVPLDLAISPDGSRIALVAPGGYAQQRATASIEFDGLATRHGPTRQLALLEVAGMAEPTGDARQHCDWDAPQWEHLFPGEALAVAFLDDERFVVQVQQPAQLRVFGYDDSGFARLEDVITLSDESRLDSGQQLFHQSAGLGLACASCHGEGQDDAHVWDFDGIGPRRTQSLRGGILGSEPFHWDGDIKDFRALVDEVLVRRMGGDMIGDGWAQALGDWIDALPAPRASDPADLEAIARGEALFAASACASCHGGDTYRSAGSFDVGTGGSFQVPSLIGVSRRLPVMHDGCAETLHQRFEPGCGGDNHGTTADLTEDDINDLVHFLSTL